MPSVRRCLNFFLKHCSCRLHCCSNGIDFNRPCQVAALMDRPGESSFFVAVYFDIFLSSVSQKGNKWSMSSTQQIWHWWLYYEKWLESGTGPKSDPTHDVSGSPRPELQTCQTLSGKNAFMVLSSVSRFLYIQSMVEPHHPPERLGPSSGVTLRLFLSWCSFSEGSCGCA